MTLIEWLAVIFSLLSVIWTIRQNRWCWWLDILGNCFYLILFYKQGFVCETILQVLFNIQCVYGLINWKKKKTDLPVKNLHIKLILRDYLISGILMILTYFLLLKYFHSSQPLLDVLTTGISLLANWYLTKKIIQSWHLWIFVDVLFIIMFSIQGLWLSLVLYIVFLCLAIKGLIEWKKDLNKSII